VPPHLGPAATHGGFLTARNSPRQAVISRRSPVERPLLLSIVRRAVHPAAEAHLEPGPGSRRPHHTFSDGDLNYLVGRGASCCAASPAQLPPSGLLLSTWGGRHRRGVALPLLVSLPGIVPIKPASSATPLATRQDSSIDGTARHPRSIAGGSLALQAVPRTRSTHATNPFHHRPRGQTTATTPSPRSP
jgi:hypothetical protein